MLKDELLELDIVKNNEFLDMYCNLIEKNKNTKYEKYKTQKHHIIPKCYYKKFNLPINNNSKNLINLSIKDHILAHYYLALCGKKKWFKHSNEFAVLTTLDAKIKFTASEEEFDFIKNLLKEINEKHENWLKTRASSMKGKHHSKETKEKLRKISKEYHKTHKQVISEKHKLAISIANSGEKNYMYKRFWITNGKIEKVVNESEFEFYKLKNFKKGRISRIPVNKGMKMDEEFKRKCSHNWQENKEGLLKISLAIKDKKKMNNGISNKYINKNEIEKYLSEGWKFGFLSKEQLNGRK